jgi:diguanylate cyclase (GGDEF)-like protein
LGGQRSTRLDVDEILEVIRHTVGDMGFAEPQVFELYGNDPMTLTARPVRQSGDVLAIPPGDPRLLAAAAARESNRATVWPPGVGDDAEDRPRRGDDVRPAHFSTLFALPITTVEDALVVVTARWPAAGAPPESHAESLDLFAAQAGASLRNAQVHRELAALKDRLAHEASHDALTELPNRRRFTEQLERRCGRGRPGDLIAVLFLDLDGFKDVNDRFGHDTGNDLLVAVAARLRSCVRPGDVVARMGGDEFTILLTRLESAAPAVEVAERICAMFGDPFRIGLDEMRISTSIGIAVAQVDRADPGDLLRRADVAMYRAKSQGKAGWAMDPGSLEPAGNGTDAA